MQWSRRNGCVLFAVFAVFVVCSAVPVQATVHKAFRFKLPGEWLPPSGLPPVGWVPENVNAVRVITNAMEVVTEQYIGWRNPWDEGTEGYTLIGGTYCTRIAYNELLPPKDNPSTPEDDPWTWDKAIKLGWSVADSECRLRDLKWITPDGSSAVNILADLGAVPGGGELLYDERGWVWRIYNDSDKETEPGVPAAPKTLPVHGLEVGVFDEPLDQNELAEITEEGVGIFDKKTADAAEMLGGLWDQLLLADLPPGWTNSLATKLEYAMADKEAGDAAYAPPNFDIDTALHLWGQAAQHLRTFASQIRNDGESIGRRWEVPDEWADIADEIADDILLLPGTQPPSIDVEEDAETLNALQATAPIEIPADLEIPPGGYVDIVLGELATGQSAVFHGDVTDAVGNTLVEWVEEVVIPEEVIPPAPPTIIPEPDDGYLYNPQTVSLNKADQDTEYICWWIGDPEDEPDALSRDMPPINITIEDDGLYKLVCFAQDACGNQSEPREVTIEMDRWHEFGGTGRLIRYLDTIPLKLGGVDVSVNSVPGTPVSSVRYDDVYGYSGNALHFSQWCGYSARLPTGTLVSSATAYYLDGTSSEMEFVLGVNTAEWAWDRPGLNCAHDLPLDPPTYSWWTNQGSANGEYYWGHRYYSVLPLVPEKTLWYLELRLLYLEGSIAHRIHAITLERPLQ
jgi:hypothetical protein